MISNPLGRMYWLGAMDCWISAINRISERSATDVRQTEKTDRDALR